MLHVPEMETTTGILALPMELLDMIAGFAEDNILNLRLTCRELRDASMDTFAKIHLQHIEGFVLNAMRMLRLLRIASTPHLARKIEWLTLGTSPFENCGSAYVHLAPNRGQSHEEAIDRFRADHNREQYAMHKDSLSAPGTINWALIRSILENIRHLPG